MLYLLECLQKTAPPVLIFCENKSDVDSIHEYLLLKGVEAVCDVSTHHLMCPLSDLCASISSRPDDHAQYAFQ